MFADRDAGSAPADRLLDVPFVPQEKALCGGAALAMVMRFWDARGVHAADFAHLIAPGAAGIRTGDLEAAARTDGWRVFRVRDGMDGLAACITRGRPVVVLLHEGSDQFHYVVVTGIAAQRVCVHDPARGPFRRLDRNRFKRAWRSAGEWAILVLPPEHTDAGTDAVDSLAADPIGLRTASACDSLVACGVGWARAGDLARSEIALEQARARCPGAAAPLTELAGVRFLQRRWAEAESLAAYATRVDPASHHAWRLLATTRFVRGDNAAALTAWNAVQEPRIDLARIEGLERTRYDVVARFLDLRAGTLLTPASLQRARRRLETLPARTAARMSYVPLDDGTARVDVAIVEKPRLALGASTRPVAVARAVIERHARLELVSPSGLGEAWTARWRWWENRPLVAAGVAFPGAVGIWRTRVAWERQLVRRAGAPVRFERRWAALECSQWSSADMRWDAGAAISRWRDRGVDVALNGAVEVRRAADRLALRVDAAQAWSAQGGSPYAIGSVSAAWQSDAPARRKPLRILARTGLAAVSAQTPMSLWPAAGSESGVEIPLRAHPLFDDGVMSGQGFGRRLLHAGVEAQAYPVRTGLAWLGFATFLDAVAADSSGEPALSALQADVGAGVRLRLPAHAESVRIDVARGTRDGAVAISVGIGSDCAWMR